MLVRIVFRSSGTVSAARAETGSAWIYHCTQHSSLWCLSRVESNEKSPVINTFDVTKSATTSLNLFEYSNLTNHIFTFIPYFEIENGQSHLHARAQKWI